MLARKTGSIAGIPVHKGSAHQYELMTQHKLPASKLDIMWAVQISKTYNVTVIIAVRCISDIRV